MRNEYQGNILAILMIFLFFGLDNDSRADAQSEAPAAQSIDRSPEENERSNPSLSVWLERFVGGRQGSFVVGPDYEFCHGDRMRVILSGDQPMSMNALWRAEPHSKEPETKHSTPWQRLFDQSVHVLEAGEQAVLPGSGPIVLGDVEEDLRVWVVLSADTSAASKLQIMSESKALVTTDLEARLARWSGNTVIEKAAEGARVLARIHDVDQPAAVELVIRHRACSRRQSLQVF